MIAPLLACVLVQGGTQAPIPNLVLTPSPTLPTLNMSVLLYVLLKNDLFPISLHFPFYQGNTLSPTNVVTSLVDFLTAYKRL